MITGGRASWTLVFLLLSCLATSAYSAWSSVPWWGSQGLRSRSALAPVAVTKNLVYHLLPNDTIVARDWRKRGSLAWVSDPLPGLTSSLPALSSGGVGSADQVYLLNRGDGRLYAYKAVGRQGRPLWRSSFVCSQRVGQEKQVLSPNPAAGVLVARCYSSIILVNITTGARLAVINNQETDAQLPFTFPDGGKLLATWKGSVISLYSLAKAKDLMGKLVRTVTLPEDDFAITSLTAGRGFIVATGSQSQALYIVTNDGKRTVKFVLPDVPDMAEPYVLPRPTLVNNVLYGIMAGTTTPVGADAPTQQVWSLFALDLSRPYLPTVLFTRPAEEGDPAPQPLTFSRNYVYVSHQKENVFSGYNLTTGELGWSTLRWPMDWTAPSIAAASYCCDQLFISTNIGNTTKAQVTAFLMVEIAQDGTSAPPVDPSECRCKGEPRQNY